MRLANNFTGLVYLLHHKMYSTRTLSNDILLNTAVAIYACVECSYLTTSTREGFTLTAQLQQQVYKIHTNSLFQECS